MPEGLVPLYTQSAKYCKRAKSTYPHPWHACNSKHAMVIWGHVERQSNHPRQRLKKSKGSRPALDCDPERPWSVFAPSRRTFKRRGVQCIPVSNRKWKNITAFSKHPTCTGEYLQNQLRATYENDRLHNYLHQ